MTERRSPSSPKPTVSVDDVMRDRDVAAFIAKNPGVKRGAREGAEWLVKEHGDKNIGELAAALYHVLAALLTQNLHVFFSYKAEDATIANQIATWLEEWSASKLKIEHMAHLGVEEVGRNWRRKIEETIPKCEWFLLLLPNPGDEREWVLWEAGYFSRGQGITGRLVCLHHPDNKVADALGAQQSVPAETDKVVAFLRGLFHEPNWIPGMPPLNSGLTELESKAKQIVNLIKPPAIPSIRSCCGPHMEVAFADASAVRGWEQLANGRVISCNDDCKRLFGVQVPKRLFGDWFRKVEGAGRDEGWVIELVRAVQAAAEGSEVPPIRATFSVGDRGYVRPALCAVSRSMDGQRVEAVDIIFNEELAPMTERMKPELAALSITLDFAVRFRYQILEQYAGRKLDGKDVQAFNGALTGLFLQAAYDRRFSGPSMLREQTLALFVGEDRAVVQKLFDRWAQIWRQDAQGEMNRAIANLDGEALSGHIQELLDMYRGFLTVTSKRFAELVGRP